MSGGGAIFLARPKRPSEPGEDEPWWVFLLVVALTVALALGISALLIWMGT